MSHGSLLRGWELTDLPAYSGIPFSDVNLRTHELSQPPWTQYSSLSEVATLCLEFTYLERAAGAALPYRRRCRGV